MTYLLRRSGPTGQANRAAIREIEEGHDRSTAVVGSAFVERALKNALISVLHPDEKLTDQMFSPTGPLGTFGTMINLGMLIGIYGAKVRRELIYISKVRNRFAHNPLIQSFEEQPVCNFVDQLMLCEGYCSETGKSTQPVLTEIPMQEADFWVHDPKMQKRLETRRGRYILSIKVYLWGLTGLTECRMPEPFF